MLSDSDALPFAQHYFVSAAQGDRDCGSGEVASSPYSAVGFSSVSQFLDEDQSQNFVCVAQNWDCVDFDELSGHDRPYPCGEALNPGPSLSINFANPTGLNGKEHVVYALPSGITCLAETHLATPGMTQSCGILRSLALRDNRPLRLLPGAAVPLRARSNFVGKWAGVFQMSDLPCHRLQLNWPQDEYNLGRVQTASFRMNDITIQGTVLYGWSPGPTWPKAHAATRAMLQHLTEELVIGSKGLRYIAGDFNGDASHFPEWEIWSRAGWHEVQSLHALRTGEGPFPTCKGRTQPDCIWISPELACHFRSCSIYDSFADHAAISASFDLQLEDATYPWWPMPSKLPWTSIDLPAWWHSAPEHCLFSSEASTTEFLASFGRAYEDSLRPFFVPDPHSGLPSASKGRGQTLEPKQRVQQLPTVKPSRAGEETLRSDLVGRSVQRWFTQLRRLQSLLHNIRRDSTAPGAIAYRLQLWQAIKSARGFAGTFAAWWAVRPHKSPGSPLLLPSSLPDLFTLELLYLDFQHNFRSFESWNLQQRRKTLQHVLREDSKRAFQSVKGAIKPAPDRFVESSSAIVVAADAPSNQVEVEQDFPQATQSIWTLDGAPAQVRQLDTCLYEVSAELSVEAGQELEQHIQITRTDEMLDKLKQFWEPRWSKRLTLSASHWDRLLAFVQTHMTPAVFDFPPITLSMWDHINHRYSATAARGPDGFDHLDLLHMPVGFQHSLLSLLSGIDSGQPWPKQLQLGFCHPLPKRPDATTVQDHRPIVILSVLYRSWSALRARPLLAQLKHLVGPGVIGFMPGREAGEVWHYVQTLIEWALQSGQQLHGVVSDVRKAFESIPRTPLFAVMSFLGFPAPLLSAWSRFLDGLERRFLLRDQIGDMIPSNWGLPEGCSLSVLGMTVIDWVFDEYQRAFTSTLPLTYVDNFELLSAELGSLMTGYASMEAFMDLWTLELDGPKTFFWSTNGTARSTLRRLGKHVVLESPDLGGAMTYCRRTGIGSQKTRFESLEPMWPRLRRSLAPLSIKQFLLRQAFWPKVFHAIGITLLPFKWISSLRARAVRALGFGQAGANPGVRLALLSSAYTTDPGFFQAERVVHDFRRFLAKDPSQLHFWKAFMDTYTGTQLSGPCCKLLEIFEQLGWYVQSPPWILDHDGCPFDFLHMSSGALQSVLEDAWTQRLGTELAGRNDFTGLVGLHWPPSRHEQRLTALENACVNSLREGAFLTNHAQNKFDLIKGDLCKFCRQVDTIEHRCLDCPALATARQGHEEAQQLWHILPQSLTHHLMPSRNPYHAERKRVLLQPEEHVGQFEYVDTTLDARVDIFTDGSCEYPETPPLSLAAWALVSATHKRVLLSGPLPGFHQSINRAELFAIYMAVQWAWQTCHPITIWTDSAYAAHGLHCIISDPRSFEPASNEDLWQQISELLDMMDLGYIQVQHVNSHLSTEHALSPLDEWIVKWNQVADTNASLANRSRPRWCTEVCDRHREAFLESESHVDLLRSLHLDIALRRQALLKVHGEEEVEDEEETILHTRNWVQIDDWLDALPLGWLTKWPSLVGAQQFAIPVVKALLDLLMNERERSEGAVYLSWLEIAVMLDVLDFSHPIEISDHGRTVWAHPSQVLPGHHGQVTVAARIRFLKSFFRVLGRGFDCDLDLVSELDISHFRVHSPQSGMAIFVSSGTLQQIDAALLRFTATRPVRCCNDLCRPFSAPQL